MAVLRVVVTQSTESLLVVAMRSYFPYESSGIACDTRGYGSSISTERNSMCRQHRSASDRIDAPRTNRRHAQRARLFWERLKRSFSSRRSVAPVRVHAWSNWSTHSGVPVAERVLPVG
jgi:hypothetical protein